MLLFIYMIYVIYSLSKMKKEGKRVSILTKIVVYGLLVLSLIKMYFSFLAFLFSPLPFFGFLASLVLGSMVLSTIVITKSFFRQQKNDPEAPLVEHWIRLGFHILLMFF